MPILVFYFFSMIDSLKTLINLNFNFNFNLNLNFNFNLNFNLDFNNLISLSFLHLIYCLYIDYLLIFSIFLNIYIFDYILHFHIFFSYLFCSLSILSSFLFYLFINYNTLSILSKSISDDY